MNKIKGLYKKIYAYFITNRLFLSYVLIAFLGCICVKSLTIGNGLGIRSVVVEFGLVIILGSFGYLIKPKNQYNYFFALICFLAVLFTINSIYYTFYSTFASAGELATVSQLETVTGSIFEKIKIADLIYIIMPLVFRAIHMNLKTSPYYEYISKIEKGATMFGKTIIVGLVLIGIRFALATEADYASIAKQWNRSSVVNRFGIILYQGNDLVQTLTPKLSSLFGYEDAVEVFKKFFEKYPSKESTNKYTGVLEGMNVIFVHMESIQTFLMSQVFNEQALTPNLNALANEGLLFTNFYPQISTGTSSDSEFTLLSSLMPAASGTIFVSYFNRDYVTIPKLLQEKGYYTFSMHGNAATMWNRNKAHLSLGYQDMYFKESFTFNEDDVINLGINDKKFFEQAMPILENIESTYENYMGTIITLSNHSPFSFLDKYGEFDLSVPVERIDEKTGETYIEKVDYLEGKAVGNYFHSVHYADEALGEFINYIKNSDSFNNTVFVFYGDHEAKLSKSNMNYLYNYDVQTGELREEDDPNYIVYDAFDHELNKKTPLIIWTKNKQIQNKLPKQVNDVMGMYDVLPTLGNLMGFYNPYALGHDIFTIKNENTVIFPNGNFLTNNMYYNNSTGEYKILKEGAVLGEDYIDTHLEYVDDYLGVSNSIVVYDLLNEQHLKDLKGIEENNEE